MKRSFLRQLGARGEQIHRVGASTLRGNAGTRHCLPIAIGNPGALGRLHVLFELRMFNPLQDRLVNSVEFVRSRLQPFFRLRRCFRLRLSRQGKGKQADRDYRPPIE